MAKSQSVTVTDVSKVTGLSTATVSRVLNNSPLVREATRNKVMQAVRELGYTANYSARALARQRTDTIGVIFPGIDKGFFSEVLMGVNEVATYHNLHITVGFALNYKDEPALVSSYVHGGRVDSLILMNLGMPEDFLREIVRESMPIVLIDRPVKGAMVTNVRLDNANGADEAMTHLVTHGYKRIAIVRGPRETFDADQRWEGCQRAANRLGYDIDPELIWQGNFYDRSGYDLMKQWLLSGKELPDAVFAFNDPMAIGVLRALNEQGLNVPQDMALVGYDDMDSARYLGLTTVRSPMRKMGQVACRTVIEQLNSQEKRPTDHVLNTELVVRRSCGVRQDNVFIE
ncbi:LacI family DNA-binding transcriptional regulator [Poriferisphaera sp. WC338]|uniref:LacI family DNA-binding transcriptional regulator n=1 Tax=Poriferisphaera sp. WC338 TaxID=3425129 RepID=UPI003D819FF4